MGNEKLNAGERKLVELIVLHSNSLTQEQLAHEINVSVRTVQTYLSNPLVKDKVNEYYDQRLWKLRPIAYKSLTDGLKEGQRWATELFFKLNGELSDKVNITGPNGEPLQITYVVENGNTGKTE
jgi:hypothetical protein